MLEEVVIQKLVHGGQGLGTLPSGQKIFVWNALPGETVGVRVGRKKKGYAEGFAESIIIPSKDRIKPVDEAYLSTSPWQILSFDAENKYKKEILKETFEREKIVTNDFEFVSTGDQLHYRNKMEYSFWGDEDGLHLALFHRASHGKRIVPGSSIARPEIDKIANDIVAILNKNDVRASQLKTIVLRTDKKGSVVAALFVKDSKFQILTDLESVCQGVVVYYSNPKSPASIRTKELYRYGDISISDTLLRKKIIYDVNSFFQVNLPIFESTLKTIKSTLANDRNVIDMYSGVGTIGLCVGAKKLVELDSGNVQMAKQNASKTVKVIEASTEHAMELITSESSVIFDPPRAGLHDRVLDHLIDVKPKKIVYLSCNPSTQARDYAQLKHCYKITTMIGYNFFPRTPHIESLLILDKL